MSARRFLRLSARVRVALVALVGLALLVPLAVFPGSRAAAAPASFPGANGVVAYETAHGHLGLIRSDGGRKVQLTSGPGEFPAWSPDGTHLAFNGDNGLLVADADGSGATRMLRNGFGPAWSADGTELVFHRLGEGDHWSLWAIGVDGSDLRRLTESSGGDDRHPAWSPDGTRIAFASDRDGDYDVYVMDADGSDVTRLTDSPGYDVLPDWSPDGTRIAFASGRDGGSRIYTMAADGSVPTAISPIGARDSDPSWSPDGTRIAFMRLARTDKIAVMDTDGSNVDVLTTGLNPAWRPAAVTDETDPAVTVTTPAARVPSWSQGARARADFACSDPAPSVGLLRCRGEVITPQSARGVRDGDLLPTTSVGNYALWVTAIDLNLNEVVVARRYVVVSHRPDALIAVGAGAPVGDGVYNTTGHDQTRIGGGRPGSEVTFALAIQNDGTAPADRIVVRGQGSTPNFLVRYRDPNYGFDLTNAMLRGYVIDIDPGFRHARRIEMIVTPKPGAPRGLVVSRLVTATSARDTSKVDAVAAVVVTT